MKKTHLIMLLTAAFMTLFSAYSLAAINQVYNIDFMWYSQYNNEFSSQKRDVLKDNWNLSVYPEQMEFGIISKNSDFALPEGEYGIKKSDLPDINFSKYLLIYGTLGEVYSLEYRLKIDEIAQKGNIVEIKVNLNSPQKEEDKINYKHRYIPKDIVLVDKSAFPVKGKLFFVFKDQDGRKLFETYYYFI
jgi:hypothetical protein